MFKLINFLWYFHWTKISFFSIFVFWFWQQQVFCNGSFRLLNLVASKIIMDFIDSVIAGALGVINTTDIDFQIVPRYDSMLNLLPMFSSSPQQLWCERSRGRLESRRRDVHQCSRQRAPSWTGYRRVHQHPTGQFRIQPESYTYRGRRSWWPHRWYRCKARQWTDS